METRLNAVLVVVHSQSAAFSCLLSHVVFNRNTSSFPRHELHGTTVECLQLFLSPGWLNLFIYSMTRLVELVF